MKKKSLLFVLFFAITTLSYGQKETGAVLLSNLEAFSNRQGTFLFEESNSLGYFSDVSGRLDFNWTVYTDFKANEKYGGLKLTIYSDNPIIKNMIEGGVTVRTTFYIDFEEIETLYSFVTYFEENLHKQTPTDNTSFQFISKEGTEYSFYNNPGLKKWIFKVSPYPYTNEFTYILKKETIDNLLGVLKQAKDIIVNRTK